MRRFFLYGITISIQGLCLLVAMQSGTAQERVAKPSAAFVQENDVYQATQQSTVGRITQNVQSSFVPQSSSPKTNNGAGASKTFAKGVAYGTAEYAANGTLTAASGSLGQLKGKVAQPFFVSTVKRTSTILAAETAEQIAFTKTPVVQEAITLLQAGNFVTKMKKPSEELRILSAHGDDLGFQHLRFEQMYNGLRIYGQDILMHSNTDGTVYSVHGSYQPTPTTLSVKPSLAVDQALKATRKHLEQNGQWDELPEAPAKFFGYTGPVSELLIYPTETPASKFKGKELRLAFAVTICTSIEEAWTYFVDANSGEVLSRVELFRADNTLVPGGSGVPQAVDGKKTTPSRRDAATTLGAGDTKGEIQAAGFLSLTAPDLLGVNQTVRSWRNAAGTVFALSDETYRTTDDAQLPNNPNGGHIAMDGRNQPTSTWDATPPAVSSIADGQNWSPNVITALQRTDSCLRYFRSHHNYGSWNGRGEKMTTIFNIGTKSPGSAFWNGALMFQGYGPGDPSEGGAGWRDLHLVGHEVGHAYNTVGRLNYGDDQSGALEEHFANFWGWMINRSSYYIFPLLFGTDPQHQSGAWHMSGIPDSMGTGTRGAFPTHMSQFLGRVQAEAQGRKLQFPHYNGPIIDRAAYTFIQKFGRDTCERIWFRVLTNYISQNTQFSDFRRATLQAAQDLYPNNSAVATALNAAFDLVGVTATTALAEHKIPNSGSVQAVRSTVAFTTQSGRIGLYDVVNKKVSYFTGNDAVVRTQGGRSQLSSPKSGQRLYFVNQQGQLAYVDVLKNTVTTFSGLQIQKAGDILNAAVAPDEKSVAMISQYANDANIYISTIANVTSVTAPRQIPIAQAVPETTSTIGKSEGKTEFGIRYADALAWSPDVSKLELLVDGVSKLGFGANAPDVWGVYYFTFDKNNKPYFDVIYEPQAGHAYSYPEFSSNSAYIVAFNDKSSKDTTDVYVEDLDRPQTKDDGLLKLYQFKPDGQPLLDASHPAFSPDDKQLALVSASRPKNLFFYTFGKSGQAATLESIALDSTAYHPYWASLDVATGVEERTDGAALQCLVSPNPTQNEAVVQFVLPTAARTTAKLYDIRGQEVMTLMDAQQPAGEYRLPIVTEGLPNGVYICRIQHGIWNAVARIIVAH